MLLYSHSDDYCQKRKKMASVSKAIEKLELLFIAGGNEK